MQYLRICFNCLPKNEESCKEKIQIAAAPVGDPGGKGKYRAARSDQETKNQKIVINEKDVQMTMNKPFIMIIKNESFDKFRFLFLGKFESF